MNNKNQNASDVDSGHCIAYINRNNQWYHCDDDLVSPISAMSAQAWYNIIWKALGHMGCASVHGSIYSPTFLRTMVDIHHERVRLDRII